jgi:hypothetical protein
VLQKFDNLEGYIELRKWLIGLKRNNRLSDWGDAVRWYCANDLFYLVNDALSYGRTINTETGQPLFFDDFYLRWCHEIEWQIANGGGADVSARRTGKSTLRTIASNIQRMLAFPESAGCLFSYQRRAAKKHIRAIKQELESNELLKTIYDDVLFEDPMQAARQLETVWSMDDGICVKRKHIRKELSMEFNAFFDGTPTGGGYDRLDFDDVEDDKALNTEEMLKKLHASYDGAINLATPSVFKVPVLMMTNTIYSEAGLVKRVFDRYKREDKRKARECPGEDLSKPGDGPMGGTAVYPYTEARLQRIYEEMRDKRVYGLQICCSPIAGEDRHLEPSWLLRYDEAPEIMGRGRNIYIGIDPSRGIVDPSVIWVWGLGTDRKAMWLDVTVKRLDPALPEFVDEVFLLAAKWSAIGKRLVEIRVENFGQATYHNIIAKGLEHRGFFVKVIPCADNIRTRQFSSGKRDREFERWATPAKQGEILIPKPVSEGGAGLIRADEKGVTQDMVGYFLEFEFGQFPKPVTDNMLDAGGLLWEPEAAMGAPLQYPSSTLNRSRRRVSGGATSAMSAG